MNEVSEFNDIESRLADAMAARAADVEPRDEDEALRRISTRVGSSRRNAFTLLGIAAALAVVVGAVVLLNRDSKGTQKVTLQSDNTSTTPSTTQSSTPGSIVPSFDEQAIWPFASSNRTFATPEEAAKSFAVDYLGMTHARLGATNDENGVKNVEVFPNDRGNTRTVVRVVEQPPRGWVVFEARADEIQVDAPARNAPLTSPLSISGQSTAFEATVGVELRPFGSTTPVFTGNFMGGSNGQMGPFSTSITPPSTDQPLVLVLFEGDASGQQTYVKATVIGLSPAGTPKPSQFVGWTNGSLMLLDFNGHVQRTLASSASPVESFPAYSPSLGLVAYSDRDNGPGSQCGTSINFVSTTSGATPATIRGGINPALNGDGSLVAYVDCAGAVQIRNLATAHDATEYQKDPVARLTWAPNDALVINLSNGDILYDVVGGSAGATVIGHGSLPTTRGRFGTIAFFDGTNISSYNPATGATVKLVQPAVPPQSLDADASGRYLIWVDTNHDLWTWDGSAPIKVGSNFSSAAW
jgi:Immunoglobulin-like domain of bacterial spore germination